MLKALSLTLALGLSSIAIAEDIEKTDCDKSGEEVCKPTGAVLISAAPKISKPCPEIAFTCKDGSTAKVTADCEHICPEGKIKEK